MSATAWLKRPTSCLASPIGCVISVMRTRWSSASVLLPFFPPNPLTMGSYDALIAATITHPASPSFPSHMLFWMTSFSFILSSPRSPVPECRGGPGIYPFPLSALAYSLFVWFHIDAAGVEGWRGSNVNDCMSSFHRHMLVGDEAMNVRSRWWIGGLLVEVMRLDRRWNHVWVELSLWAWHGT